MTHLEKYSNQIYRFPFSFRPYGPLKSILSTEQSIHKREQKEIRSMIVSWLHEHAKSLKEYQANIRHSIEETNQYT